MNFSSDLKYVYRLQCITMIQHDVTLISEVNKERKRKEASLTKVKISHGLDGIRGTVSLILLLSLFVVLDLRDGRLKMKIAQPAIAVATTTVATLEFDGGGVA